MLSRSWNVLAAQSQSYRLSATRYVPPVRCRPRSARPPALSIGCGGPNLSRWVGYGFQNMKSSTALKKHNSNRENDDIFGTWTNPYDMGILWSTTGDQKSSGSLLFRWLCCLLSQGQRAPSKAVQRHGGCQHPLLKVEPLLVVGDVANPSPKKTKNLL